MTPSRAYPDRFALIIGAMKCGTTSLFEVLAQHPAISACRVKEPNFFSEPEVFARGCDWYRSLWEWERRHEVALEASASYTKAPLWPHVPQRISSMPDARFRFIYVVRHPVARVSSQVRHSIFEGWGASLDEGLPDDAIEFSRYAMQADRYSSVFGEANLMIVILEEFSESPRGVLKRVCEFLEVDADYEFASPERRYNKGDLYHVSGVWSRLLRLGPLRALADRLLPRSARHALRDLVGRTATESGSASGQRVDLREAEQAQLIEILTPDLRRLRDHYRVDIERFWGIELG